MHEATGKHTWVGGASLALLFVATLAGGCAVNSEMTNVWRDPTLTPGTIQNALVVAIRRDPVRRRLWEDAFVTALAARHVSATASYRLFPDALPDTQQVIEAVNRDRYDVVLTSTRLPNQTTSQYVPGAIRPQQVTTSDYYGRFHSYWVSVQDPGYNETDTILQLQTDLWANSPEGGRLIWSGTFRTLESVNGRTVEHSVNRYIMPQLDAAKLLPPKSH